MPTFLHAIALSSPVFQLFVKNGNITNTPIFLVFIEMTGNNVRRMSSVTRKHTQYMYYV